MRKLSPPARLYTTFFAASFLLGSWYPRIPDVQTNLKLDSVTLGWSLSAIPIGVMLAFTFGARLTERIGFIGSFAVATPALGAALVAATLAWSPYWLFAALLIVGAMQAVMGIAGNVEAKRVEAATQRKVLVRGHGFWSLATLSGGTSASLFRAFDISPGFHLSLVLAPVLVILVLALRGYMNALPSSEEASSPASLLVLPTKAIGLLFFSGGVIMAVDSAAADWSGIFMRDALRADAATATLAFIAWASGTTTGRLFHANLEARFGSHGLAVGQLALAASGLVLVIFSGNVVVAVSGFALTGLGTSSILPMALAKAAGLLERPRAVSVASLSQLAFMASILSPLAIGGMIAVFDVRVGFALALAVVLFSALVTLLKRPLARD